MGGAVHIFGIRHHGPGSARSLRDGLTELQPDILLVEGPPDAADVIDAIAHPDMQPPVAILIYSPDHPQESSYYPFSEFSPEFQAMQYALGQSIPVHFIDLPQTHQIALRLQVKGQQQDAPETNSTAPESEDAQVEVSAQEDLDMTLADHPNLDAALIQSDPLSWLAQAAGYSDGERWWDQLVEQRQSSEDVFLAIQEAMQALREEYEIVFPPDLDHPKARREAMREAHMRKMIRKAQKEGYEKIAVVCGAWHGPALVEPFPPAKHDNALLKGLPKCKLKATWIPWTYERLTWRSGYGAGVESPGWYHHLWSFPTQTPIYWLTRVARLLREQDIDASSASVIEAVRLAETLATMRDRPAPGLTELSEAAQTVLCFGDELPMKLIQEQLIVSDRLGQVPTDTPLVPLQADLLKRIKSLRLKLDALSKELELDLRKPNDLMRSQLFHRLNLLGIPWAKSIFSRSTGTFKEAWRIEWEPEFEIALIEAGQWGNTVAVAAVNYGSHCVETATDLPTLTTLLDQVLLADLQSLIPVLMRSLQEQAAVANDLIHLMTALPPLVNILRYQDVRQTDTQGVAQVVDGLVIRICVGFPGACASLDDEAAAQMHKHLSATHRALKLLQSEPLLEEWRRMLMQLLDQKNLHGLLAGYSCRLLLDEESLTREESARRLRLALSTANEPAQAANWIDGFLQGSGLLLLHDEAIWSVLDQWVTSLTGDTYIALLPLLRRTFAHFSVAERRQMGDRVRVGKTQAANSVVTVGDIKRAEAVLPRVAQLLGLSLSEETR